MNTQTKRPCEEIERYIPHNQILHNYRSVGKADNTSNLVMSVGLEDHIGGTACSVTKVLSSPSSRTKPSLPRPLFRQ